jgi:hypothetical protein
MKMSSKDPSKSTMQSDTHPNIVEQASHMIENVWETTKEVVHDAAAWVGETAQGHPNERPSEVIADDLKKFTGYDDQVETEDVGSYINEPNNRRTIYDPDPINYPEMEDKHSVGYYLNEKNDRMTIVDKAPEILPEVVEKIQHSAAKKQEMKVDTDLPTPKATKDPLTKRQDFRRHKAFDLRNTKLPDDVNKRQEFLQHKASEIKSHMMADEDQENMPHTHLNVQAPEFHPHTKYPGKDTAAMKGLAASYGAGKSLGAAMPEERVHLHV